MSSDSIPSYVGDELAKLDFVSWDRFTIGTDPDRGTAINVYGWIDREDEYKDFVVVTFYVDTDNGLISYVTSSARWTDEIARRLFGTSCGHNECRRVEEYFGIENVVSLHDQSTLTEVHE